MDLLNKLIAAQEARDKAQDAARVARESMLTVGVEVARIVAVQPSLADLQKMLEQYGMTLRVRATVTPRSLSRVVDRCTQCGHVERVRHAFTDRAKS